MIKKHRLKHLAWSEYLPLAATAAMWAIIVLAIGHADTARLLAAVTMVRGVQMLTKLATPPALKRRTFAPKPVRRQAKRLSFKLQTGALIVGLLLVALLVEAMKAIGQHQIAGYLPYVALGMPARYLRLADVRTASPYFRMALGGGGLLTASIAWAGSWPVTLFGLAFGAREWVAYVALRWWPRTSPPPKVEVDEKLRFAEVARYSVVLGRRLLTYRLTKTLLTVFGPFGNAAARTGRGLNWHRKIEPYVPHHLGGFITFSLLGLAGSAFLAMRSGEPAAMIVAAGLLHITGAALNVVLLWRWLPDPDDARLVDDDEE